jgi:homoserine dehydrogenase
MDIAIMGYGVVGSGVAKVVSINQETIAKKSLQPSINVKYILDLRDFPGDENEGKFTKDFNDILKDDDVKVVVETMGGQRPAFEFVSSCLKAGKSVVTSNKELVAAKGDVLLKLAEDNNANFLFEASVGGGIPIIRPIDQCLAANRIDEVAGILNGTTNFILTMMIYNSMSFEDALKLAQDNGYAEKDPTADIEGYDACRKICILASLCFGKHVFPENVYTEGITKITLEDVDYARSWGGVIKLLGRAKRVGDKISAIVSPAFVSDSSILAGVNDVFNAVLVRGNAVGDVAFYGRGAGKMATASAVVADIMDCARHLKVRKPFGWDDAVENYVIDNGDVETSLYVRAKGNKVFALKKAEEIFGDISVLTRENAPEDEFAFVTPVDKEAALKCKLDALNDVEILSEIRVENY